MSSGLIVSSLIPFLVPTYGFSSIVHYTGEEVGFWSTHSVVFAEVTSVERVTHDRYERGTHRLQIRPKATLAGNFDSALHPTLDVAVWIRFVSSGSEYDPKTGFALLVLRHHNGGYVVPSAQFAFMSKSSGIVSVEGFDDPLVEETIESLGWVRRSSPFE